MGNISQSLNFRNFFSDFIIHPFSNKLNPKEQKKALAISILLGFTGIGTLAHVSCFIKERYKIHKMQLKHPMQKYQNEQAEKVNSFTQQIGLVKIDKIDGEEISVIGQLSRTNLSKHIQTKMVDKYYRIPPPAKEEVTVPHPDTGEWVKWVSLTLEDKIRVNNKRTHEHNQLKGPLSAKEVDENFFTHEGHFVYLPNDPRQHHGSDHCVRAALFAGVFGYLYKQFHPSYQNITEKDILLAQFIAAGHDSGRQTEGPDVYDERSSENTVMALKELGITNPEILKNCRSAIENKDAYKSEKHNLSKKDFISKCVQNADCAEFARLWLKEPQQPIDEFARSRGYLDIYNELFHLTDGGKEANLMGGKSFQDFVSELDALRYEMNDLIFSTHQKEFRQKTSTSNDYYNEILKCVDLHRHPLLHKALEQTNVL